MKVILAALFLLLTPQFAFAWGDDGHKVVALIAEHYLTPDVRNTVAALLAQDTDPLTQHDIASEATWADKYRNQHRETGNWHFVDIEIDNPDISSACGGRPPLPPNTLASNGPPACILDKIQQFTDELSKPGTDPEERLVALKFLLHFVGDLHQPLHSSDNHDRGGNQIKVIVDGFEHNPRDELHAYWDTQFVRILGRSPKEIAQQLMDKITPENVKTWSAGTPDEWSMEAFKLSKADVYGDPPLTKNDVQHLDAAYVDRAAKDVALQLSRAGVRLTAILNKALSSTKGAAPSTSTSSSAPPKTTKPNDTLTTQESGGTDQFQSEAEAKVHCRTGTVVWANLRSSVYHFAGYPSYGNTKRGAYMCEVDATRQGIHAAKAEQHP
jgi:hypothetical protein